MESLGAYSSLDSPLPLLRFNRRLELQTNLQKTERRISLCTLRFNFGFWAWQVNKFPSISAVMFTWVTMDVVLPPCRPGLLFRLMLSISMPSLQNVKFASGLLELASQISLPILPAWKSFGSFRITTLSGGTIITIKNEWHYNENKL